MSLTSLTIIAAEAHSEPAVSPYVVGAIALGLLLASLLILIAIGGGREHS
ncbi:MULTISPECIES: hypothetical protein [unclassified Nocardioides]|nr:MULTISPECIES: hypothetical protein [unclassified Nocardioides]